jgi:site-specific DNA-methyltransferase (adenine-specific)
MKKPGICCPVIVNKKYNIVNSLQRKNKLIMPLLREQLALFIPKQQPVIGYREVANVFNYSKYSVGIKQDDCIDFLRQIPNQSVDVIVTDPAYSGMNNKLMLGKGRIVGKYKDKGSDTGKWFQEFQDSEENYSRFLTECKRILKVNTGHIYIMFDSYSLLSLGHLVRDFFNVKNLITWDKVNMGMGHYFRRRHEYIIFSTNGNNRKIRTRNIPDVWQFKRIHNAKYVTQKPIELFQAMIFASAEEGFTICDPFMGSGSSAIAAIKNKCNFIGCDISFKAIDMSSSRISNFLNNGVDIYQLKPSFSKEQTVFWEEKSG